MITISRSNIISVLLLIWSTAMGLVAPIARAQSSPSSYTTAYRYDSASRLVGAIQADPDGSGPLNFPSVRNTYDSLGMLVKVESGELSTWQSENILPAAWSSFTVHQTVDTTYDFWGRKLTDRVSSSGTSISLTQYSYDNAGRLQCTAVRMNPAYYDSLPSDACTLGPEGNSGADRVTRQTYDTFSRPLTTQKGYGTPQQINYITTLYYPRGPKQSDTDANGNLTYYSYDGFVRLKRQYFPSKETSGQYNFADYEEYTYDDVGNRTSFRRRNGNIISYIYDNLNRLNQTHYPVDKSLDVFNDYDLRNLQLYARFGSQTGSGITTSYDGFGNVKSSSINLDGNSKSLSYSYDAENRRTRMTFPDGQFFLYTYDGIGRAWQILESNNTILIENTYDSQGHRNIIARGGKVSAAVATTTFQYDPIRLKTLSHDLDGASNVHDQTWSFNYNPANQTTTKTLSNDQYAFVRQSPISSSYTVNGLNQYTSVSTMRGSGPSYDDNGNMTSDGSNIYNYDAENRLVSASGGRSLRYDPNGRLYQSSGASGTTTFLFDGDALVAEYASNGVMLKRYVHGAGVDEPLVQYDGAAINSSNRNYLYADRQGSIVAITNASGTTREIDTYDEYGVPGSRNMSRFQYTGQIALPDLAMYYYKARIYSPQLGRFLQTDRIGYKDDIDLYTYVGNDPINRTDPTGNSILEVGFIAADVVELGSAISSGAGVGAALGWLAVDAVGVLSPVPGVSEGARALKFAEAAQKVETVIQKGGSYRTVKGIVGNEAHHMPSADALKVSDVSRGKGPSISMSKDDHALTKSHGSSKKAIAYREQQKQLIKEGKFEEAQKMDIDDVRSLFGTKYDEAINKMREYTTDLLGK